MAGGPEGDVRAESGDLARVGVGEQDDISGTIEVEVDAGPWMFIEREHSDEDSTDVPFIEPERTRDDR